MTKKSRFGQETLIKTLLQQKKPSINGNRYMRKSVTLTLVLVFAVSSILSFLSVEGESRTIVIPDDYASIQEAIDNANNGDTIFVKKGIYEEHTLTINKTIMLIGEDKENTTIINIDGPPPWDLVNPFPPSKPDTIHITADNVKISGFTITCTSNDFGKIIHATGNGIQIIDNVITELNGVFSAIGIDVYGERNQIINNSISGVLEGISFSGSYFTVIQNTIENGQFLGNGDNNLIMSNVVSKGYTDGINLNGDNNLIFNNTVTEQNHGIWVYGIGNSLILNSASNNVLWGIAIRSPIESYGNNTVYANTIAHNRDGLNILEGKNNTLYANNLINNHVGMTIVGYKSWMDHSAYNNTFYHNNFIKNNYGAADWSHIGTNAWDNGFEGNFWDYYNGTDSNHDGIGDTAFSVNSPYTIGNSDPTVYDPREVNFQALDRYPLMTPFNVDSLDIKLPEWTSLLLSPSSTPSPADTHSDAEPEFFPTTLVVASLITVAVIGVSLVVYFRKRKR